MSYSDYFRKLNFSAVASGVQNMKNNEFSKLTNPINQQIDGFQSDIEGLQKSLFLMAIILMSLNIPQISRVFFNQIERNEGKQKVKKKCKSLKTLT